MGQAFARGLSDRDLAVVVSDPSIEKIQYLEDMGINITDNNEEAIKTAEIVIIAVKPGMVENVLQALKFNENQLVMSIAAGIKTEQIMKWADAEKVVRVMPNTPALVGYGMSVWVCSESVTDDEKLGIQQLLATVGDEVELEDEDLMNSVTAISGSGPAYVFYFLEAMAQLGEELGLEKEVVDKLAIKTFIGASMLAQVSQDDFLTLRQRVTSKGGTTEAALNVMDEAGMKKTFMDAMRKAAERSEELSGEN